jgi:hypothetical protein
VGERVKSEAIRKSIEYKMKVKRYWEFRVINDEKVAEVEAAAQRLKTAKKKAIFASKPWRKP